jgi:hypothetical protein
MISGLDSARVKIGRAAEHVGAIRRIINSLASTANSYEIVKDADGKEKIRFLIQPPPQIAVLAGEVVYQLRSALDHLAFDLVKRNQAGITLPANWDTRCDFPMWLRIPDEQIKCGYTNPPLPYNCFTKSLPGISKTAFTFIEGVQPYRNGAGPHNALRLIANLSNIDRHRYLNVTLPKAAQFHYLTLTEGRGYSYGRGGLKDGAEIEQSPPKADDIVEVQRRFSTYVTFDEPAVGSGTDTLEVEHVLEVCLEQVKNVVIPAFIHLLKNP